jgi:hypothetical protein
VAANAWRGLRELSGFDEQDLSAEIGAQRTNELQLQTRAAREQLDQATSSQQTESAERE